MESQTISLGRSFQPVAQRTVAQLERVFSATLVAGLIVSALVIVVRCATGAVDSPLSSIALALTGVILATVAAGARFLGWGALLVSMNRRTGTLVWWTPGIAAVAVAIGVSLPKSSPLGLGLLWLTIVGEEAFIWTRWRADRAFRPDCAGTAASKGSDAARYCRRRRSALLTAKRVARPSGQRRAKANSHARSRNGSDSGMA